VHEGAGGLIRGLDLDLSGLRATVRMREAWRGWDHPQDADWLASKDSDVCDMTYCDRAAAPGH
jgi:hypothetical protein